MNRRAEGAAPDKIAARRADLVMVERGLFGSRAQAQAAIAAGTVQVEGTAIRKPSMLIARDARIEATPAHPYVSRGGVKLAHALERSGVSPAGRTCLDVGASTGGFTEVLLAHGARRVYAVDVGSAQLHSRLRQEPRIVVLENTDIRNLASLPLLDGLPDLAVIDVSFISLKHVLAATVALLAQPADLIVLVKPQFEVGRAALKKGIVRDADIQARVVDDVAALIAALGWQVRARFPSPIAGGDGNREFFIVAHHSQGLGAA
jgi:23S rRNA (cytidine1920-2'-O)/16S rRNA (cytidine1409-2'-O)-methyltransferase